MGWPAAITMCGDRQRKRHLFVLPSGESLIRYDIMNKDVQWPSHFPMTSLHLLRELTMTIKRLINRRYNAVNYGKGTIQ